MPYLSKTDCSCFLFSALLFPLSLFVVVLPGSYSCVPFGPDTLFSHSFFLCSHSIHILYILLATKPSGDCGVTAQWPTPWPGHCIGAPCREFNDCSGELICQGWPQPVCTKPRGGQ